jgi:hypothetical protein
LLGLALPQRAADQTLVEVQQSPRETSTKKIAAVVERLLLEGSEKPPEDA